MMFKSEKITGVYCWTNKINGCKYIGSTNDIPVRYTQHVRYKSNIDYVRSSPKLPLYAAFDEFGFTNFSFEILLLCEEEDRRLWEDFLIADYESDCPTKGYNIRSSSSKLRTAVEFYTELKLQQAI